MPKDSLTKQFEKLQKEAKQQKKEELNIAARKDREEKRMVAKEAERLRAATIVGGQPNIGGMRILDKTAEIVLRILIDLCTNRENGFVNYKWEVFPINIRDSISLEIEKLIQYGMISPNPYLWMSGGNLHLLPTAYTYFDDKKSAIEKEEKSKMSIKIESLVNSGNFVIGDITNSSITISNKLQEIERRIEEEAEDKEDLREILDEVKDLLENIESSRSIPKHKVLFKKIMSHVKKHSWFYAEIIALLGQQALQMMGA